MKLTEERKKRIVEVIESIPQETWDKIGNDISAKSNESDVRNMLIEFGNWLYEDDLREMDDGFTERVVDRFLNTLKDN